MKKPSGKINVELENAIADELKAIRRKAKEDVINAEGLVTLKKGEYIYPLKERMEVIDRALKIEQLKLKVDDSAYGSNFGGAT